MTKILVFLLMLAGAMLVLRLMTKPRRREGPNKPVPPPAQRMVACALCGLHVPEAEAVRRGEAAYCCEDHRRRAG